MPTENQIIGDIPIYYINLDKSKDRLENIVNQFGKYDIKNTNRVSAIDGSSNEIDTLKKKYRIIDSHKRKRSNKEIACTLSHIKAINQAYIDGCDIALIMEDDCCFDYLKFQNQTLHELVDKYRNYEIYQLAYIATINGISNILKRKIIIHPGYLDSACAYIIKRSAMIKIINCKNIHVSEITIFGNAKTCYINRPYFTYYYLNKFESTIHSNTNVNPDSMNHYENISKSTIDEYYENTGVLAN